MARNIIRADAAACGVHCEDILSKFERVNEMPRPGWGTGAERAIAEDARDMEHRNRNLASRGGGTVNSTSFKSKPIAMIRPSLIITSTDPVTVIGQRR